PPEKPGYRFVGWYSKVGTWDAAAPLGGDPLDLDAPVYMSNSYWPKYEKNVTVSFRNYDDTGDDVLPKKEMTPGDTLTIPAAPDKANEYFLGWAEAKNAANTTTLYVPQNNYTDIRLVLNTPDKNYLGYKVKSAHEINNIQTDKTLYAVYYKQLGATNNLADDFIWSDAIYRVINISANSTKERLVIKVNALTDKEVMGSGDDSVALVKFRTDRTTFFDDKGKNGYEGSTLEAVIDKYYEDNIASKSEQESVLGVNLNNPDFDAFQKSIPKLVGAGYNNWSYGDWYKVSAFPLTVTRDNKDRKAFALSYDDLNTYSDSILIENAGVTNSLRFIDANEGDFWLRSVGNMNGYASRIASGGYMHDYGGNIGNTDFNPGIPDVYPVRPALYLTVN
ncbi:MAG: InlB B-repeat-containing protein, partial [Lactococcus chungangensis]